MKKERLFIEEMAKNVRLSVKVKCWLGVAALYATVILITTIIVSGLAKVALWLLGI